MEYGDSRHFPFCFRFQCVEVDLPDGQPPRTLIADGYDMPPLYHDHFQGRGFSNWFRWTPDSVIALRHTQGLVSYKASTLFWYPERHGYLVAPYDCTREDAEEVRGEVRDWRRLTFRDTSINQGQHISVLGYSFQHHRLGSHGRAEWFPDLLTEPYKAPKRPRHRGQCQLAGDLSMIIGLVLHSAKKTHKDFVNAVKQSFRPEVGSAKWRRHDQIDSESMLATLLHFHQACPRAQYRGY